MATPRVYAVVLDGTNAQVLTLPGGVALEVIPGGTVTVQTRLGDGNDNLPLTNGNSYTSPSNVSVVAMNLRLLATSATTATVILWV